jgi:hypothetical protein
LRSDNHLLLWEALKAGLGVGGAIIAVRHCRAL